MLFFENFVKLKEGKLIGLGVENNMINQELNNKNKILILYKKI